MSGEHVADAGDAAVFAADHGEPFQREGRPGTVSQKMLDLVVKEAMTPTPIVIGPEAPLPEAARIMVEHGIHHPAVTENKHRFLGLLSSLDILRAVAEGSA